MFLSFIRLIIFYQYTYYKNRAIFYSIIQKNNRLVVFSICMILYYTSIGYVTRATIRVVDGYYLQVVGHTVG